MIHVNGAGFCDHQVPVLSTIGRGPQGPQGEAGNIEWPTFADPIEWDVNTSYPKNTVVTHDGDSYVSRQDVPADIDISDNDYWVKTADFNAQLQQLGVRLQQCEDELIFSKAYVNPSKFGAVGDGVNDDTQALQAAIDSGLNVRLENGKTYLVSIQDICAIKLTSNIILDLNGATIKLQPNSLDTCRIMYAENEQNVLIRNGSIVGDFDDRSESQGTGDWCCGIYLQSCVGFMISDVSVSKCYGDGIAIAGDSKSVDIARCTIEDNGRNGLSLIRGVGVRISNCAFGEVSRTNPMACIDIEPNNAIDVIDAVVVEGCAFENTQKAFMVYDHTGSIKNILVTGCTLNGECHVYKNGFSTSTQEHMSFTMRDSVIKCDTVPVNVLNVDTYASMTFDNVTIFSDATHPIEIVGTDNRQSVNMLFDIILNCPNATCIIHNNSSQQPLRCNIDYTLAQDVSSFADNNVTFVTTKRQGVHYVRQSNSNTDTDFVINMGICGYESASTSIVKQITATPTNWFDGFEFFLRQSGNGGQISFTQPSGYAFIGATSPVVISYPNRAHFKFDAKANCIYVQK